RVRVVEQVEVQEADEKEAVVFGGRSETVKEMDREVPATYRAVMVVAREPPWVTGMSAGLSREKSNWLLAALCARAGLRTKHTARSNRFPIALLLQPRSFL